MAAEMKEKMSGYLVDAMTFRQNKWREWIE